MAKQGANLAKRRELAVGVMLLIIVRLSPSRWAPFRDLSSSWDSRESSWYPARAVPTTHTLQAQGRDIHTHPPGRADEPVSRGPGRLLADLDRDSDGTLRLSAATPRPGVRVFGARNLKLVESRPPLFSRRNVRRWCVRVLGRLGGRGRGSRTAAETQAATAAAAAATRRSTGTPAPGRRRHHGSLR